MRLQPCARVLVFPFPIEALYEPAEILVQHHQHCCAQVLAPLLPEQRLHGTKGGCNVGLRRKKFEKSMA